MPFQKGNKLGVLNKGRKIVENPIVIDAAYHKEWRKNNPVSFLASQKKYRENAENKKKMAAYRIKRNFGITIEQYEKFLVNQQYRCAICHIHQSEMNKCFDIDHDHVSMKVRGLLCNPCNQALGLFRDSQEKLLNALNYLRGQNAE